MLDGIAGRIVLMEGWRRWLLAAVAGAVASLALPPLGLMPAYALALPVLVWLIDGAEGLGTGARLGAAFAAGWAFGFGFFAASLFWIAEAFYVEADVFGWMAPFAVPLLAGGLALFHGAGVALARLVWSDGPWRIAALALGLGAAEWARGHVATGFPWNVPGMVLAAYDAPAQGAALVGLHGLSVIALLVFAAPATLAFTRGRSAVVAPVLAALALGGLWAWGALRPAETVDASGLRGLGEETWVRIVQPAVPQDEKWQPGLGPEILEGYLALSRGGPGEDPRPLDAIDMVIWPESAFPFVLVEAPAALARITALAAEGPRVVTGALRLERGDAPTDRPRAYNSLYVIDDAGIEAAYDKTHLVPFGEYLPWQSVLERIGLEQITRLRGGFEAGALRHGLGVPGLPPFQPLICYEAIFPGALFGAPSGGARSDWLVNVTNDAWFGQSIGPAQHLAHARLRAIEEGLPLLRAANTGISAAIDPYGRTLARLDVGVRGAFDVALPRPIAPPPFVAWRWRGPLGMLFICTIFSLIGLRNRD